MIRFDSHTHTKYSHDADKSAEVRHSCLAAVEKGLTHLAITDHYDINEITEGILPTPDLDRRSEDILSAKEEFGGKLVISHGIELGQAIQYPDKANALLDKYKFETVIASVHDMRGHIDFYHWDMKSLTEEELRKMWTDYLVDIEETVDFGRSDILAHLNYPLRYAMIAGRHLDVSFSKDAMARIMKKAIARDMLFEVNSSGFRQGIGAPLPSGDIIALYKECGGRLISVGSDAHTPRDIAADYDITADYIKKYGFDRIHFKYAGNIEEQKI